MFNFAVKLVGLDSLENEVLHFIETVRDYGGTAILRACDSGIRAGNSAIQRKTGNLQGNASAGPLRRVGDRVMGAMVWPDKYASYVDSGTQPHTITAKRARRLRVVGRDGGIYFPRTVNHPGIQNPVHFADAAKRVATETFMTELERAIERAAIRSRLRGSGMAV